ncbi:MAG: tol-pal system protein YbgF [Thermodesulfovibrionales bacterium]
MAKGRNEKHESWQACLLLCCSVVLLLSIGCVTTSDIDSLRNDVNSLKRDTFELRKETSDLRRDINSLKEQSTGTVKEESFNAIRESQTMILSRISDLSKDLQVLSGRFEESKFFTDKSFKEWNTEKELMRGQINSLEARLKELNDKLARLSTEKQTQKVEEEKASEKVVEEKSGEPLKAYEQAYELYKEKKYKEARDRFNNFLKDFPKSDLADNAQFWIGETYYAEKDFEGAILAYEMVIKNYPQSEKLPGAMLKQGMAFFELGDKKTAKVIFDRLIEKFPDSKEAETAKKKKTDLQGTIKKKR